MLRYLHKLFKRDHHKGQRYHERQIGLYAEYDRPNLLPFLRDSIHCPLEKALEICQERNFVEETVFLLSRMGNCRRALQMIMEELEDVDKAIEFAKEQDDAELWEDLISYSIDKPRKSHEYTSTFKLTWSKHTKTVVKLSLIHI
ncbi:vacuolar protein sorting-associated protein 41 homolog [Salvelinus sp. IW2-2015]|uniref:vacuolar protein sorting-associated protein 41 homolog n=1 Tax=Salvelinus sp. IW2-2015 TaxID=2691554 RepID=UPI0038D4E43A